MQSIYILQWRYIQLSVNEQTRSEGFMTHLRYLRYLRFAKTVPGADRGSATGADHMSWYPPWSHPWSAPHTPPGSSPGCVPRPSALIDFVTWLGSPPGVDLIRSSICSTVLSLVRSCFWGSDWLCRTCRRDRGMDLGPDLIPSWRRSWSSRMDSLSQSEFQDKERTNRWANTSRWLFLYFWSWL